MRAFLAFDISNDVIGRLTNLQQDLKSTKADVGLVSKDNLHFTVKFLGEVPDETVQEVDRRIRGLDLSAFDVSMNGIGVFPDIRSPKVVWAGVTATDEAIMTKTAQAILVALEGIGKSEDRGFRAHVTIGRVRSARNLEGVVEFVRNNKDHPFGVTRVDKVKLKSSVLTPNGPIYRDIREYAFK
jgi:2'-5' RNA ligase